jgi:hypothetical protein
MNHPEEDNLRDYCPNCGSVGYPEFRKSGSTLVEILLWLCGLLPGLIYSLWRVSSKRVVCASCDHSGTIPLDSRVAQAALAKLAATGTERSGDSPPAPPYYPRKNLSHA